jgi:hypothetical protein
MNEDELRLDLLKKSGEFYKSISKETELEIIRILLFLCHAFVQSNIKKEHHLDFVRDFSEYLSLTLVRKNE